MREPEVAQIYMAKTMESLAGAASELANGRYHNAAKLAYYACFQAAIAALLRAGIEPKEPQWAHRFVHSQFVGQLFNRRRLYPAGLRRTMADTLDLRQKADYSQAAVTRREAIHVLEWATALVTAVQGGGVNR